MIAVAFSPALDVAAERWREHRRGVLATLDPQDPIQETLARRIARLTWRMNESARDEEGEDAPPNVDPQDENAAREADRHEAHLDRSLCRLLAEYRKLKKPHSQEVRTRPKPADTSWMVAERPSPRRADTPQPAPATETIAAVAPPTSAPVRPASPPEKLAPPEPPRVASSQAPQSGTNTSQTRENAAFTEPDAIDQPSADPEAVDPEGWKRVVEFLNECNEKRRRGAELPLLE